MFAALRHLMAGRGGLIGSVGDTLDGAGDILGRFARLLGRRRELPAGLGNTVGALRDLPDEGAQAVDHRDKSLAQVSLSDLGSMFCVRSPCAMASATSATSRW